MLQLGFRKRSVVTVFQFLYLWTAGGEFYVVFLSSLPFTYPLLPSVVLLPYWYERSGSGSLSLS